jgi:hypothetical protein
MERSDNHLENCRALQLWHLSDALSDHGLGVEQSSVSPIQANPTVYLIEALRSTGKLHAGYGSNRCSLSGLISFDRRTGNSLGAKGRSLDNLLVRLRWRASLEGVPWHAETNRQQLWQNR